jgi:hypothetical protein
LFRRAVELSVRSGEIPDVDYHYADRVLSTMDFDLLKDRFEDYLPGTAAAEA